MRHRHLSLRASHADTCSSRPTTRVTAPSAPQVATATRPLMTRTHYAFTVLRQPRHAHAFPVRVGERSATIVRLALIQPDLSSSLPLFLSAAGQEMPGCQIVNATAWLWLRSFDTRWEHYFVFIAHRICNEDRAMPSALKPSKWTTQREYRLEGVRGYGGGGGRTRSSHARHLDAGREARHSCERSRDARPVTCHLSPCASFRVWLGIICCFIFDIFIYIEKGRN